MRGGQGKSRIQAITLNTRSYSNPQYSQGLRAGLKGLIPSSGPDLPSHLQEAATRSLFLVLHLWRGCLCPRCYMRGLPPTLTVSASTGHAQAASLSWSQVLQAVAFALSAGVSGTAFKRNHVRLSWRASGGHRFSFEPSLLHSKHFCSSIHSFNTGQLPCLGIVPGTGYICE